MWFNPDGARKGGGQQFSGSLMPAATWKSLAALKVSSRVFSFPLMFEVWFCPFDGIMFFIPLSPWLRVFYGLLVSWCPSRKQKENNISHFFQMTTSLGAVPPPANRGQCLTTAASLLFFFLLSFLLLLSFIIVRNTSLLLLLPSFHNTPSFLSPVFS